MSARPVTLAIAVALLAIIGAGVAFAGVLLLAVAMGAVPFLAPSGGPFNLAGLLGVTALVTALVILASAAGLWMRRGWAWAISLIVAASAVIGAVIVLDSSGAQLPTVIGLVLSAATGLLLFAPQTRSAAGVA